MTDNSQKYFLKWVNMVMKPTGIEIKNLATDFSDGTPLVAFLEQLSGTKCPTKLCPPKNEIFKLQNLNAAMEMAKKMLKNLCVNGRNFISGKDLDVKYILGFIFDLVLHYQVDDIDVDGCRGQNGLLMWAQKVTAGHDHCKIDNFSLSWRDGMAFMALAHAYSNSVDYSQECQKFAAEQQLSKPEQIVQYRQRMGRAVSLISELMGVEQILDEEFAEFPNDKANITYISLIFKVFGQAKQQNKSQDILSDLIKNARIQQQMQADVLQKLDEFQMVIECGKQQITESQQQVNVIEQLPKLQKQARETMNQVQLTLSQLDNMLYKARQHQSAIGQKTLFELPKPLSELQKEKTEIQKQFDEEQKRLMDLMKDFSKQFLQELMANFQQIQKEFSQKIDFINNQLKQLKPLDEEASIQQTIAQVNQIQQTQVEALQQLTAKAQNVQLTVNQQRTRMQLERIDEIPALAQKQKQMEDIINKVLESLNRQLENLGKKKLQESEQKLQQLTQEFMKIADKADLEIGTKKPEKKDNQQLKEMLDQLQQINRNELSQLNQILADYQAQEIETNDIRNQLMVDRQENASQLQNKNQALVKLYNEAENALRKAISDTNQAQLKFLQDKAKKSFDQFNATVVKTEKYVKNVDLAAMKSEKQLQEIILSLQEFEKISVDQTTKQLYQYQNDQLLLNQHLVTMAKEKIDQMPDLVKKFAGLKNLMVKCIQACQQALKRFQSDKLAEVEDKFQRKLNQFYQLIAEEKQNISQTQFQTVDDVDKLKLIQQQTQQNQTKLLQKMQQNVQQLQIDQNELNSARVQLLLSKIDKQPELSQALQELSGLYKEIDTKIEEKIAFVSQSKMQMLQCAAENAKLEFEKFCKEILEQFIAVTPDENTSLEKLEENKKLYDQYIQLCNKEIQVLINNYVKEQQISNRYRVQFSQSAIDHQEEMQKTRDELVAFYEDIEQQLDAAFSKENNKVLSAYEADLKKLEEKFTENMNQLIQQIKEAVPGQKDFEPLKQAHMKLSELSRNAQQIIAQQINQYQNQLLLVNNQRHKMILTKLETPEVFQQSTSSFQLEYNSAMQAVQKDLDKLNVAKLDELIQKVDKAKSQFNQTCETFELLLKEYKMPQQVDLVNGCQQELTEKQKEAVDQLAKDLTQFLNDQLVMNQQRLFMGHKKVDYTQQLINKRDQLLQAFLQKQNELKQFQITQFKDQLTQIEKLNIEKSKTIKQRFDEFSLKLNQVDTLINYKLIQSVIEEWLELNSKFANEIQLEINEIESNNLKIEQLNQKFNQQPKKTIQDFSFLLTEANEKVQNLIKELKVKYEEGIIKEQELVNIELRNKFNQFCVKDPSKNSIQRNELEQMLIAMDLVATTEQLDQCFKESVGFEQVLKLINKLDNNQENIEKCLQAVQQLAKSHLVSEQDLQGANLPDEDLSWVKQHISNEGGKYNFQDFITKFYQ
uniref:Calponin homology (CH) domain-containing protein n=1 Tax=Trepomonas sp. PC1 TaxID=1076344 RepID=A0A146K741_9EUKA|eukprot:JAP91645.1 Calponin homology (CH) domain-containing protein [Trepomonas sp. PC1]